MYHCTSRKALELRFNALREMALPALTSTENSTNQATHLPTHSLNWSILLDSANKESILTPGKK
jgi:hypothetical protein